jgi:hypothetical protein
LVQRYPHLSRVSLAETFLDFFQSWLQIVSPPDTHLVNSLHQIVFRSMRGGFDHPTSASVFAGASGGRQQ